MFHFVHFKLSLPVRFKNFFFFALYQLGILWILKRPVSRAVLRLLSICLNQIEFRSMKKLLWGSGVLIVPLCTHWISMFNSCSEIWFGQMDLLWRPVDIADGLFDILHGLKVLYMALWGVAWHIFFSFPFSTCHEALRTTRLKALVRAWVVKEEK